MRSTIWPTAIWFDSKNKAYLLPIKGEVRKKENIFQGQKVEVELIFESYDNGLFR